MLASFVVVELVVKPLQFRPSATINAYETMPDVR